MALSLADTYVLKAVDAYPFDMEQVSEALGYALSYNHEHAGAHCLLAMVYANGLQQNEAAKEHFELALLYNPAFVDTYERYARFLMRLGELEQAQVVLNKGLRMPGVSRYIIYYLKAIIAEMQHAYPIAIKWLKKTAAEAYTQAACRFIKDEISRIKLKKNGGKKKKRKKEKKSKKHKKANTK